MTIFEQKQIFENLYAGPPFNLKDIRSWLKKSKLKMPVNVIAIELEDNTPEEFTFSFQKSKAWIIDSDRNMLYITYNGSPKDMEQICDKQSLLHGDSIPCDEVIVDDFKLFLFLSLA